ncbi:Structural maintenance of chromosomes protein 2 [Portunus trituberculatus]|uniref:Structural maintenance of chromosomes protein 2 n=1 Tax=Portunus trituberculatus TaxID=210409 RepID=A0A5B7EXD9_PORTR|nr:Structural maintenance of chromosomes protein 2 [Portunus trituberculatus]
MPILPGVWSRSRGVGYLWSESESELESESKSESVRATNLQELVYKNGQAGVTKATVSITFDNTDKKQSPIGYDHYSEVTITRQVVIGGRNKYMINGSTVQNSRVQDFFRSVQLNVNNPHFLIMQGRITKVLSMKPPECIGPPMYHYFYDVMSHWKLEELRKNSPTDSSIERIKVRCDEAESSVLH